MESSQPEGDVPKQDRGATSIDLTTRRTGLAFQRTRLAADRTLMAVIRTALSLIGFGFTFFTAFRTLHKMGIAERAEPVAAAARFGLALTVLGIATLVFGIWSHRRLMQAVRHERSELVASHLLHGQLPFNVGSLVTAYALLAIGLIAILAMVLRAGPFG